MISCMFLWNLLTMDWIEENLTTPIHVTYVLSYSSVFYYPPDE